MKIDVLISRRYSAASTFRKQGEIRHDKNMIKFFPQRNPSSYINYENNPPLETKL